MKNVIYCICFLALVSLSSCSSSSSPGKVALIFMESIENGDFDKAIAHSTEATQYLVNMMNSPMYKEQMKKSGKKKAKYEIVDTKVDGDKAICKLKMTDGEGNTSEPKVNLVKKDGKWLVDMNKEEMDKEDMPSFE